MLAPPTLAYGWVNSQSSVVAGCQRALNKFGDAARDVDTALMSVGGQNTAMIPSMFVPGAPSYPDTPTTSTDPRLLSSSK